MTSGIDAGAFCREIEAYLCRKNDGHLIRIAGPAFERVCGWAAAGVPLKVAFRGIDRCVERYYAKGPRRRPVRIEYCEADVLDVFDEWRRAVGVGTAAAPNGAAGGREAGARRRPALHSHLERAVARLTASRSGPHVPPGLSDAIDRIARELDAARAGARTCRGASRARLIARLSELDAALLDAARAHVPGDAAAALRRDAERELDPFRTRMPPAAFDRSVDAAFARLLRERYALPVLTVPEAAPEL